MGPIILSGGIGGGHQHERAGQADRQGSDGIGRPAPTLRPTDFSYIPRSSFFFPKYFFFDFKVFLAPLRWGF